MTILDFKIDNIGQAGVVPHFIYIATNNTVAEVTAEGFLNKFVAQNNQVSEYMMALVATKTTPNEKSVQLSLFDVSKNGDNWSLVPSASTLTLEDGKIFVGNASDIAVAVNISGDATMDNEGVLTIEDDAITTAKILDGNVTLAKLAAGITPSHVIKFAGQLTTVGGAAAEAFTVTGAVAATDIAFVQIVDDGTANVTALQAVVTNNTLTVTFSANPGNDCVFNYQIIRAVS
jgi:hypothetical protein